MSSVKLKMALADRQGELLVAHLVADGTSGKDSESIVSRGDR